MCMLAALTGLMCSCQCMDKTTDDSGMKEVKVMITNLELYKYRTGMSGDEQGARIFNKPMHALTSTIIRDASTNWEPVYHYQSEPGFTGTDWVVLELIEHEPPMTGRRTPAPRRARLKSSSTSPVELRGHSTA